MAKTLIIVESPAKARTIAKYLGKDFIVESSIGHIRDLPSRADEIPEAYRKKPWARTGVDVENGFTPLYIVPSEKKAQVKKLKDLLKDASALFLATDEDREGEAIAWHLKEVLSPKVPTKRMVFHEITEKAIKNALKEPRAIDERLVDAQEARRILDRLYGYEVSPILWRKVAPRLSAGRVQSVATRLCVERERLRIAFRSGEYWGITAQLDKPGVSSFQADLQEVAGRRVAIGKDFDDATGQLKNKDVVLLDGPSATTLAEALPALPFTVSDVQKKPFTQKPYAPFITSTLQQEASRKLRFTAQRAMRTAQRLYENGFITYMRTDSTTLSQEAVNGARTQIAELFGAEFLPAEPRVYANKVKGAQEAHEAIRPAGEIFRTPESVKAELDEDAFRLYDLIWKRTMASQMKDAFGERTSVKITVDVPATLDAPAGKKVSGPAIFSASGKVIQFAGFLRAYVEGADDPEAELEDQERVLPALAENDRLKATAMEAKQSKTQPPARYTEASLVKELEDRGIGRPSTYASIIQTIQDRGYVFKKGNALVPTFTAFAVINLLEQHFGELVDYAFTAKMEGDLDTISNGEMKAVPWLKAFYFGDGKKKGGSAKESTLENVGLKGKVGEGVDDIDPRGICEMPLGRTEDGQLVAARVGRYGPYVQIGDTDKRANIPDSFAPDELTTEHALGLIQQAGLGNRAIGIEPVTGKNVYLKTGRFGPYVQLGEAELNKKGKLTGEKPRMSSLWPGMTMETLTLDQALQLLSFPKSLGAHPETGLNVVVCDGKFGPYVMMEGEGPDGALVKETRSLESRDQMTTMGMEDAVALLKQPKIRGLRQRAQAQSLKDFGVSPVTKTMIQARIGRFGAYVTDGEVNATIPSGRDPASLSFDDALELIAQREAKMRDQGQDPRGPQKGKRGGRPTRAAASSRGRAPPPKAVASTARARKAPTTSKVAKRSPAPAAKKPAPAKKASKAPARKAAPVKKPAKKAGKRK